MEFPFEIKISETDITDAVSIKDRETVQQAAQIIYNKMKARVPELEKEKESFFVTYKKREIKADLSKLSIELQDKIKLTEWSR